MHSLGNCDKRFGISSYPCGLAHKHWALPQHPMPFVFFVLICDAWEICLMFCKQRGQKYCWSDLKIFVGFLPGASSLKSPMHCIINTYRQKAQCISLKLRPRNKGMSENLPRPGDGYVNFTFPV